MKKGVLIIGVLSLVLTLIFAGCATSDAPAAAVPAAETVNIESMLDITAAASGGAIVSLDEANNRVDVRGDAWSIAVWQLPEGQRDLSMYQEIVIDWTHNASGRVELQPVLLDGAGRHLEPESDGWRGLNAGERGQSNVILGTGPGGMNITAAELSDVHKVGFKLHSNSSGASYHIYSINFQ
ncbi:hypothetical protein [Spirochaeta dissipatitropha]